MEFQREKEEKRLLEGRIAMLTGQMIGRGRRSDGGALGVVRDMPRNWAKGEWLLAFLSQRGSLPRSLVENLSHGKELSTICRLRVGRS